MPWYHVLLAFVALYFVCEIIGYTDSDVEEDPTWYKVILGVLGFIYLGWFGFQVCKGVCA
jgi:hypothetical protein